MQGAQNGPGMDQDPVGPRHRVAGAPLGYKHGKRDQMRSGGKGRGVARAAQQPLVSENMCAENRGQERSNSCKEQETVPRMDEDPVGPHDWLAGGLLGYKHGMRDETRGLHQ